LTKKQRILFHMDLYVVKSVCQSTKSLTSDSIFSLQLNSRHKHCNPQRRTRRIEEVSEDVKEDRGCWWGWRTLKLNWFFGKNSSTLKNIHDCGTYFGLVWWRVLRLVWSYTASLLSLLGEPPKCSHHGATVYFGLPYNQKLFLKW